MTLNVDTMISQLLAREGSTYTNDPSDKGGPTKYGWTQASARDAGYTGDMADLTAEQAAAMYKLVFWTKPKFDQLATIDGALANKLFDIGVNRGQTIGVRYVQRALNVFNYQGKPYADLVVDGLLGGGTFGALKAFYNLRGAPGRTLIYQVVQALQATDYIAIAERDATQEKYIYGWLTQRAFGV